MAAQQWHRKHSDGIETFGARDTPDGPIRVRVRMPNEVIGTELIFPSLRAEWLKVEAEALRRAGHVCTSECQPRKR